MIPAYIINGFLESGKTEFLNFTLTQEYFQMEEMTLVIACEDGENEYDHNELKEYNVVVEYIETQEDFTSEKLSELEKKHNAKRVMIEWNGVWDCKKIVFPKNWEMKQQISLINAETFEVYYANMRSLMMEMLKNSELVLFNRCDDLEDSLITYKRNVKLVNQQCEIIFEGEEGEISVSTEEDLPYDLNSAIIKLDGMDYAICYMDCMDYPTRYDGKTIRFIAQVYKEENVPEGHFILGRHVMTCCEDDVVFFWYPCKYSEAASLENGEWVNVTARFEMKESFAYEGSGPLLDILSIEKTQAPKQAVIE